MRRIFITGSSDGLGLAAARRLLDEGHQVLLHARSRARAEALRDVRERALGVAIGDLSIASEVHSLAVQVNGYGRMDSVIHNAGVYLEPSRGSTPEWHAKLLAINVLAPYLLTAWIERPDRLIYLSSGLHRGGTSSLEDLDWTRRTWNAGQAYADSKLHIAALSAALARLWPQVITSAVDPGWVPTKMGGPGATGDLEKGHLTQTWLAVSDDEAAKRSGRYWHHRQYDRTAAAVTDHAFQDGLLKALAALTGVDLMQSTEAARSP